FAVLVGVEVLKERIRHYIGVRLVRVIGELQRREAAAPIVVGELGGADLAVLVRVHLRQGNGLSLVRKTDASSQMVLQELHIGGAFGFRLVECAVAVFVE